MQQLSSIIMWPKFKIGPIVSYVFFQTADGKLDYPSTDLHSPGSESFAALHALRSPFTQTGDFLAHEIRARLFKYETFPRETLAVLDTASRTSDTAEADLNGDPQESPRETLERAKRTMKKAIKLCNIYPGDAPVWDGDVPTPDRPFTLHWHDFRLANILVEFKISCYVFDPYTDNGTSRLMTRQGLLMDTLILKGHLLRRSGLRLGLSTGFPIPCRTGLPGGEEHEPTNSAYGRLSTMR